jgi:ACS family tartrate transporter-like MFS transporter
MIHQSESAKSDLDSAIKKAFWHLMPILFVGYIISFLDRVNVGFAALTMSKEIGLTATMFGWGAGLFFISYCFFELPSNLILHRVGARVWIARIMITWGLISASMVFVSGPISFYIMRFLLGLAEAGFAPGVVLYLTYWIPAQHRSKAIAMFLVGAPVSSLIGSPVSGYLLTLDGVAGWSGWQWLFIIEGLPAILLGICCLFALTERPSNASWLTEREKTALNGALERESRSNASTHGYSLRDMFTDRRITVLSFVNFFFLCGLFGVVIWLPQIIKGFGGVSNFQVGLINAIPYTLGAIAMVAYARHADKTGERIYHLLLAAIVAGGGLIASVFASSLALSMVAITVATIGIYAIMGVLYVISTTFLTGRGAAGGIALIGVVGNLGGFVGPYLIGWTRDYTGSFAAAMLMEAGFLIAAGLLVLALKLPSINGSAVRADGVLAPNVIR